MVLNKEPIAVTFNRRNLHTFCMRQVMAVEDLRKVVWILMMQATATPKVWQDEPAWSHMDYLTAVNDGSRAAKMLSASAPYRDFVMRTKEQAYEFTGLLAANIEKKKRDDVVDDDAPESLVVNSARPWHKAITLSLANK